MYKKFFPLLALILFTQTVSATCELTEQQFETIKEAV